MKMGKKTTRNVNELKYTDLLLGISINIDLADRWITWERFL
jgi:hypothetical protein